MRAQEEGARGVMDQGSGVRGRELGIGSQGNNKGPAKAEPIL